MKLKNIWIVLFFFINLLIAQETNSTNSQLEKPSSAENVFFNAYEPVFSLLVKDDFFINLNLGDFTQDNLKTFFAKIDVEKPKEKIYRWVDIPRGKPLSLKTYQGSKAKRISEDALKRINQAHSYLKSRDVRVFQDINLDIILRQHFSISAAQSAFLVARMFLQQNEQGAVEAFPKALDFFAYVINAHRFTEYSDGAFMLLIPALFERGYYKMAGKLLNVYRRLQGKIVKIKWNDQLTVRPEGENIQLSKKEIEDIKKRFSVTIVLLAKEDMENGGSSKKVIEYLTIAQKIIDEMKRN